MTEGSAELPAGSPGPGSSIEIVDLEFRYGVADDGEPQFALGISRVAIARGQKVAVIGPSGSGKSTFLSIVAGILPAVQGRVIVEGVNLTEASDAARRRFRISRVGLVFQEFELLEHLSVRENVLLPYFVNSAITLDGEAEARLQELTASAGIQRYLSRRPRALSQGERQRVAICRALITQPSLLLADEPTGNLDPETARRVLDLLIGEAERRSATLLMVTHDHGLVSSFDRVIDFDEIRQEGAMKSVAGPGGDR